MPPPPACPPGTAANDAEFDRFGVRVPLVVSPWSRPGHVPHVVHDHTSVTRFIEVVHGLPAMTARDANASALLDLFDFSAPALAALPALPAAGGSTCTP